MIDYAKAVELIDKTLTKDQISLLRKARDGIPFYELHKEDGNTSKDYDSLFKEGLVAEFKYEYVRAMSSVPGFITTEDGEKVLNTIDGRINIIVEDVDTINDDGDKVKTKSVKVNNPVVEDKAIVQEAKSDKPLEEPETKTKS